jgi:hypothetical protein
MSALFSRLSLLVFTILCHPQHRWTGHSSAVTRTEPRLLTGRDADYVRLIASCASQKDGFNPAGRRAQVTNNCSASNVRKRPILVSWASNASRASSA